jgi:hypothetical protein
MEETTMLLFKGKEKAEVRRWIVDLERTLDEMNRTHVPQREIHEQEDTLAWLRNLLAAEGTIR